MRKQGAISRLFDGIHQKVRAGPVPHHVCDRVVDQDRPQHRKQHQRPEFDPLSKRTDKQRRRDHGEGHLEHEITELGNVDPVGEGRRERPTGHPGHKRLGQSAEQLDVEHFMTGTAGEGDRIAEQRPHQASDRNDHKHLHQHAEHVLGPNQAAIEQRETRNAHHQHQGRRDQHPGGVTLVDHSGHLFGCWVLDRTGHGSGFLSESSGGRGERKAHCTQAAENLADHC